ncbi:MAG: TolC family protein [Sedimentisphaerales bacterium]|nr:TolC family protein [Sedimentisphaerales bacterium]
MKNVHKKQEVEGLYYGENGENKPRSSAFCLLYSVFCVLILAGCKAPDAPAVKKNVDDNVYRMIDRKWKDEFGVKANYRIDSAEPYPNDISLSRILQAGTILTLPQAVALATDHNRMYQLEKENLYAKALDLRLTRHTFDLVPFGAADAGYAKDNDDEAITTGAGIGVNKLLATGATIGVGLTAAWVEVLTGNARSGLARVFTAIIDQPLLKGSDPNIVLEDLTQAERDLLYQVRSFNRFRKQFVVTTISQYYLILQAYDAAENARNNYETLVSVCDLAEKLAAVGRLPQFELDQAVQDKLIARDTYIQAEKTYRQLLDEFKLAIALPTETEIRLDYNELATLRSIEMKMPDFSETEAIETALAHRLDLANAFDAVNDAERKVFVALDNLRPDLRFVAAVELKGSTDPIKLGGAKDAAFVGLKFDPNLDKVSLENDFRLALIVLDQNQRAYEEKLDTVILDIREAFRNLAEATQRYIVQSEQLALAKRRFDSTMVLLQYARANTRDVLDAQKDLHRAQDVATEAMINYAVEMLRFYRDTEILQVRPDGMPASPASRPASRGGRQTPHTEVMPKKT